MNLRLQWATGIDVLEAIDAIVDGAEGNGQARFKDADPLFAGLRRSGP